MMSTVNLTYTVVTNPDSFVGFKYYVKAGDAFDADDFAESYKLNRADLDADDVLAAQDAAAKLMVGEWLTVSHSIAA
jgi:hypothetical protein